MDPSFVTGIISIPTTCVTPKGDTKCSGRTRTKCSVRCSGYGSASFPASSISFSTSASLNRCISFLAVVAVSCPLLSFSTWICIYKQSDKNRYHKRTSYNRGIKLVYLPFLLARLYNIHFCILERSLVPYMGENKPGGIT